MIHVALGSATIRASAEPPFKAVKHAFDELHPTNSAFANSDEILFFTASKLRFFTAIFLIFSVSVPDLQIMTSETVEKLAVRRSPSLIA